MLNMVLPKIEVEASSQNYGHFVVSPLESGYGITLGNALRRVLLSSLPGAAVTSLRVSGIHHEFSAVPHVREDMTRLILNVKQIRLRAQAHIGKQGRRVRTVGVLAAQRNVEANREAGEIARAFAAAQEYDLVKLEPEVLKQLLCPRQRQPSLSQVALQPGQHVLVETPRREAAGVGLDLQEDEEKPDRLQCLVKGLRRVVRQVTAVGGDLRQLGGAARLCFSGSRMGMPPPTLAS